MTSQQQRSANGKTLIAFDFDHTVVNNNTDIHVQSLAKNGLPDHIKNISQESGWTAYMGAIFRFLHESGVTESEMKCALNESPLVSGMKELFTHLQSQPNKFEMIIVSDSNTQFINWIMEFQGFHDLPSQVYSNPAAFDKDGCLIIEGYHVQDWCDLSNQNMCKGHIVDEHIKSHQPSLYKQVIYVGDGQNDYCPSLRLTSADIVCARKGFRLESVIQKEGNVEADVTIWDDAHQILSKLT